MIFLWRVEGAYEQGNHQREQKRLWLRSMMTTTSKHRPSPKNEDVHLGQGIRTKERKLQSQHASAQYVLLTGTEFYAYNGFSERGKWCPLPRMVPTRKDKWVTTRYKYLYNYMLMVLIIFSLRKIPRTDTLMSTTKFAKKSQQSMIYLLQWNKRWH